VRLGTAGAKGCLSRDTALAMVFKLARAAERHWRRLNGPDRLAEVIRGVRFRDGVPVQDTGDQAAA
jgi:putative transposase